MAKTRTVPKLLDLIARVVVGTMRVTHATIFLKDRDRPRFVVAASQGRLKKPVGLLRLEEENPLASWMLQYRQPLVYEKLKLKGSGNRNLKSVVEEMERLRAAVSVPILIDREAAASRGTFLDRPPAQPKTNRKLKGFLLLGEKLSGKRRRRKEMEICLTLADQAAVAIENAEASENLKKKRDQMLRSERLATIRKFSSDMAHKIRNPLQAIMTFFDLLPEKYRDPNFRDGFSKIAKAEAERINQVIRNLATHANPRRR